MPEQEFTMDELREIEEEGREYAIESIDEFSDKLGEKISRWCSNVVDSSCNMGEMIEENLPEGDKNDKVSETYYNFVTELFNLSNSVGCTNAGCRGLPMPEEIGGKLVGGKCYAGDAAIFGIRARMMNKASKRMTGEGCATYYKKGDPYPLSMMVNDTTQCYHSLLREYEKLSGAKWKTIGKCTIKEGEEEKEEEKTDKDIIDACSQWDKTTEKFNKNNLYSHGDYAPLNALCWDKKCEITVGDAPGHRTHLELDKGTVDYYDNDKVVNETMHRLFSNAGLRCKIRDDGVSCTRLDRKNIKDVAKRLAGATSMDMRMSNEKRHREFWGKSLSEMPGMGRRCKITLRKFDPVSVETCLIEEKIKLNEWEKGAKQEEEQKEG